MWYVGHYTQFLYVKHRQITNCVTHAEQVLSSLTFHANHKYHISLTDWNESTKWMNAKSYYVNIIGIIIWICVNNNIIIRNAIGLIELVNLLLGMHKLAQIMYKFWWCKPCSALSYARTYTKYHVCSPFISQYISVICNVSTFVKYLDIM